MVLRKTIVLFLSVFCFSLTMSNVYAQKQYLEITNLKNNRTKKIKENKKITVFTKDLKVKGALKILDNETILIKDTEIKISDILMIRNKSILVKLLSIVVIPIGTLGTLLFVTLSSGSDSHSANIGIIGISALLLSTQLKKKYKSERYKFKIVYD